MTAATSRFQVGERVRVKQDNPQGNPRTPKYIRGQAGTITLRHGVVDNPVDHRGLYPPLYTVLFDTRDVFGAATAARLMVDLHEEWLEPA